MPKKHVLVTLHHSPIGRNGCVEGLRAAVGLTAGTEENTVACIFFGDAVHFALAGADRADAQKHLDTLAGMGAPLLVDAASLQARHLPTDIIDAPFQVADRTTVIDTVRTAGASLAF